MQKRTDFDIIDEIQEIRSKNNVNWMDLLRLAFEIDPDRARKVMIKIDDSDNKISNLIKELATND